MTEIPAAADRAPSRAPGRARLGATLTLVLLASLAAAAVQQLPVALAAGSPNISLTKSAPAKALFGSPSSVTLTASSPAGQPYGYNLSFRDVLPAGVSYVAGSSSPAPTVLANKPAAGQTTLIWSNVSDLSPNGSRSLSYQVMATTSGALRVGDSYTNNAGAYIEGTGGERTLPRFDANGQPVAGSFTGSAIASAATELIPLRIVKNEPSPEGELLRGVHANQTIYTLTVSNNLVNATNGVVVDDYVPAALEFLGCGGIDNGTTGVEYPGSGSLAGSVIAPATCPTPTLVDTVLNPAGYPAGIYTHVRWTLGNLAAGAVATIQYKAGIPIHANTLTFAGGTPTAASRLQAANLDNNTGPEAQDEQALTNLSSADGAYQGATNPAPALPLAATSQLTRTAEDLRILKSVNPTTVAHGQLSTWSLDVATSEYRGAGNITVTDTLPNGLCPLDTTNLTHVPQVASDAECAPQAGQTPSIAYASPPVEQTNGSWTITFAPADLGKNGHTVITFPSVTRVHYQASYADSTTVLANDSWTNTVHETGTTTAVANVTPTASYPAGTTILDDSSASQSAGLPGITKQVATRASIVGGACPGGSASFVPGPAGANYRAGDLVCWRITLPFSSLYDTTITAITDFLPAGYAFVPGSEFAGPTNSLPGGSSLTGTGSGSTIAWTGVGTPIVGSDPAATLIPRHTPAYTFDVIFQTRITDPAANTDGDITSNLAKTSSINTNGVSDPIRSSADASIEEPQVTLAKGVKQVNAGAANGPNVDGVTVRPGDAVTFRVDLSNSGTLAAGSTVAWDVLPVGITCLAVSAITAPGGIGLCTDDLAGTYAGRAVIRWSGLTVPAAAGGVAGALELDYQVAIPTNVYAPGQSVPNTAGVVSYATVTDDPANPIFTYVPAANIDPTRTPNTVAASDPSNVLITGVTHTKTRTTSITESGNTAAQATIGELVNYTVTEVIPSGTKVTNAVLDDVFGNGTPARQTLIGTPAMTLDGGAATGFTLSSTATTIHVDFPTTFSAVGGDRTLVVTYATRVTDVAANVRGAQVSNLATLTYLDSNSVSASVSNATSTRIVEPNLTIAKSHSPAGPFRGSDAITYTLTVTNPSIGNVSTAHEIAVRDVVPVGLTPVAGSLTGGLTQTLSGQTLSWTIGTLAPGATATLTYGVTVDNPIDSNRTLTNRAGAITSNIAGSDPNERSATDVTGATGPAGYHAATTDTVNTVAASIAKSVTPTTATIGDVLTYTVVVTVPSNVALNAAHVDDAIPAGIAYDSTTSTSCAAAGGGACSPDVTVGAPTTGAGTVSWPLSGAGSVSAVARLVTIVYSAHVTAGTLGQVKQNTASINWTSGGVAQSAAASANVTITEPVVALNKHVSCDGATPIVDATAGETDACNVIADQPLTYTIVVRNTGTASAHDITITDTKAAHLVGIAAISAGGVLAGNVITWNLAGPLAPNATVTLSYTGQVAPAATPLVQGETIPNTAVVSGYYGQTAAYRAANPTFAFTHYQPAPVTGTTRDLVTLTVQLPHLTIAKVHTGSFVRGANDQYAITVGNNGTTATSATVTVDDQLPLGLVLNGSPSGTGWTCTVSSTRDLSCSTPGTAAAGASLPAITVPVTALTTAPSSVTNTAQVTGGGDPTGPRTGSNTSPVIWSYDLAVQKTVDHAVAQPTDTLVYGITVTNNGPGTSEPGTLTDTLPAGVTLVSAPGCAGVPLICALPALVNGATQSFTITVTIDAGVADATTLGNSATATTPSDTNGGNDTGSATTVVHDPQLAVAKTHPGAFARGTGDHYDITVSNAGTFVATKGAVTLIDDVPAGLTPTAVTGTGWTCTLALQHLSCTRTSAADVLAPGASWPVIRVDVDVLDSAPASLQNDATASGGNDPTPATGSNTSPVVWSADLGIVKTVDRAAQLPGGTVTYTLTATNHGPGTSDTVTVTDDVPAAVTFVSVGPTPACSQAGGIVTCGFGHLANGEVRTVTVVATLDAGLPPQLVIPNTASVSVPTGDANPANDSSGAAVAVGDYADVQIDKSGPATVLPGGAIGYTLTARNNGPTTTALNTVVSDSLPVGLTLDRSSVAIDGVPIVLASGTPATGTCAATAVLTCVLGDLTVGATRTITFSLAVPVAPTALAPSYTNVATITSDTPELSQDLPNDTSSWTTSVPYADVSITKQASSSSVVLGGSLIYTLVVTNHGPSGATAVVIDDVLPTGLTPTEAALNPVSAGTCVIAGSAVHCTVGDRPVNDVVTVSVSASVDPALAPQTLTNTATVGAANDFDPTNNAASAAVSVTNKPPTDLQIDKQLLTSHPVEGGRVVYRLAVRNLGANAAENVVVTDPLPSALELRALSLPKGVTCTGGPTLVCRLGTIAAGATVTLELTAVVDRLGTVVNNASVSSTTADTVPANNRDGVSAKVSPKRTRLTIEKTTASPRASPGARVAYTITVRNAGGADARSVEICDAIPAQTTFVSAPGARYEHGQACWRIPRLAAGGHLTVSLVLRVDVNAHGKRITNVVTVTSANADRRSASARIDLIGPRTTTPATSGVTG